MSTYGLIVRDPATKKVLLDTRTAVITRVAAVVTVSPGTPTASVTLPTDGTLWWAVAAATTGSSASVQPTVVKSGLVVSVTLPADATTAMAVVVGVY